MPSLSFATRVNLQNSRECANVTKAPSSVVVISSSSHSARSLRLPAKTTTISLLHRTTDQCFHYRRRYSRYCCCYYEPGASSCVQKQVCTSVGNSKNLTPARLREKKDFPKTTQPCETIKIVPNIILSSKETFLTKVSDPWSSSPSSVISKTVGF